VVQSLLATGLEAHKQRVGLAMEKPQGLTFPRVGPLSWSDGPKDTVCSTRAPPAHVCSLQRKPR
jgi:hypothetical protein